MAESTLNVRIVIDNKVLQIPYVPFVTTAEDACVSLCKQLGVGKVARHIFALREHNKPVYLMPAETFPEKAPTYDLRIRYKVAHILRLKKVDIKAYDYYFHQARNDVLENKVPELSFEKYRRELVGLGVTDMYRVMLEKDIPRETVESDYKKYIPKEVLKKHQFFIKKPIHDTLGKIRKAGHDAWYVKEEYLKQLEMMAPDYPFEEYKALMDKNGFVCTIYVRVLPYNTTEPGVKYCLESKKDEWFQICTIEELEFVSIRKDCTVQLSRLNGIPFYLKFSSLSNMYSFVSLLDGYYRLTAKWTFNICKDVLTPSLQRLYSMKCHGPVGGEFSYAKLEEKRNNLAGCFILRECETRYNTYFLDVCTKDSLKPKTFKLEGFGTNEFIFNDDLTPYSTLSQLMASYKNPEGAIYLAECLPPSEYDKTQLLLCKTLSISGDTLAEGTEGLGLPTGPICINAKDLQVYKGRYVYILPQWKESGYSGGIRFSVKQWNPDLLEGLVFEIYPMSRNASIRLVIGAEQNEKIVLYKDQKVLKKKTSPRIIPAGKWNALWLQIRQGEILLGHKKEDILGLTTVYKCLWKHVKGKRVEVAMKVLKMEHREKYLKDFLGLSGQWAFIQSNVIVKLFGVTLTNQFSMVMEYLKLGPLDEYLREKKAEIKFVDLLEASSNLAAALWHLAENGIVHGNIRCRKLLVSCHDENSFKVKLADPGIHTSYASKEVHWIPVECYHNLNFARRSTAADVWAFATTLWEIFMCGEVMKQVDHTIAMKGYSSGKRLTQPQLCTSDIYKLMIECWDQDPHRRKHPQAIMRDINQILYQTYNSRQQHAYAKVKHLDTVSMGSVYSNSTESTNVTNPELMSVIDMSDSSEYDLSSKWSGNFETPWLNDDDNYDEEFFNVMPKFDVSNGSLDSINSLQSVFEFNDYCIVLQGRIGQGFFGDVYKGMLENHSDQDMKPKLVAVKKLKQSALSSCLQDFEMEIKIMKKLKHPNIVEILGVVQEPEIQLVMEYVPHGSLQSYLKFNKDNLSTKQLLQYALDIAQGMDYLGKMNIVHRDLASRNILVVDDNHVKISDFGLARVIDTNSYYILKRDTALPIKWYAMESLAIGKFSTKSDVWSYGVTMCEMFAYGEEPDLPNIVGKTEGHILLDALEKGIRFPRPPNCPSVVYARLIHPCWDKDPHTRPPFIDLCKQNEELLTQY